MYEPFVWEQPTRLFTRRQIPEANCTVVASRGYRFAIRRESYAVDAIISSTRREVRGTFWRRNLPEFIARGNIPNPSRTIAAYRSKQVSCRRKGKRIEFFG